MTIKENLHQELSEIVNVDGKELFLSKAPGRIEVLGNHTDYNAGLVLSATIDRYVWALGTRTEDLVLRSIDMEETYSFDKQGLFFDPEDSWIKYAKGVFWALERRNHNIENITAVFKGNLPIGGGLSSSAALEVCLVNLIKSVSELKIHPKALAMLAFEAERLFCGISCGVMDQFSSQLGKANSLLGINCMNLQTFHIPFNYDASFLVIDSMVKREASEALNARRLECIEALKQLQSNGWEIHNLSSLVPNNLEKIRTSLDENLTNRVEHVVLENNRVKEGTVALREGNLSKFGNIMIASHKSSRDLYEVSHQSLDFLVETSSKQEGVLGSRMSGAGFGGNVLALVKNKRIEEFKKAISEEYDSQTGTKPNVMQVSIPGGAITQEL